MRVHNIYSVTHKCRREPPPQRRVDPRHRAARPLAHAHDLDVARAVLGRHRAIGRLLERHRQHLGAAPLLSAGEIERDALAAADAERADHVRDLQRPSPLSITRGVLAITDSSVDKNEPNFSSVAE